MVKTGLKTEIEEGTWLDQSGSIIIGSECHISKEVVIYTHHHNEGQEYWKAEMADKEYAHTLVIGDHVFIGRRAIILPSCQKIGSYSTVGAGSVITHDIGEGEVWAGNPAKLIKKYES